MEALDTEEMIRRRPLVSWARLGSSKLPVWPLGQGRDKRRSCDCVEVMMKMIHAAYRTYERVNELGICPFYSGYEMTRS